MIGVCIFTRVRAYNLYFRCLTLLTYVPRIESFLICVISKYFYVELQGNGYILLLIYGTLHPAILQDYTRIPKFISTKVRIVL